MLKAIGDQFGESVRSMVEACSDSLNDGHGKRPWRLPASVATARHDPRTVASRTGVQEQ